MSPGRSRRKKSEGRAPPTPRDAPLPNETVLKGGTDPNEDDDETTLSEGEDGFTYIETSDVNPDASRVSSSADLVSIASTPVRVDENPSNDATTSIAGSEYAGAQTKYATRSARKRKQSDQRCGFSLLHSSLFLPLSNIRTMVSLSSTADGEGTGDNPSDMPAKSDHETGPSKADEDPPSKHASHVEDIVPGRRETISDKVQTLLKRGAYDQPVETLSKDKGKKRREHSPDWDESVWTDANTRSAHASDALHATTDDQEAEFRAIDASLRDRGSSGASNRNAIGESSSSALVGTASSASAPTTPQASVRSTPVISPTPSPGDSAPGTPSTSATDKGTPSRRRTFAEARQALTGVQSKRVARATRDPNEFRVRNLPTKCEVTNPLLQDEILREFYDNLPNLQLGAFIPWSNIRGSGQFRFSHWGDLCPNIDFENALAFINFVRQGRYLNPSRESPTVTRAVRTTADGMRMNLYVDEEPAILLTTVYVRNSYLTRPPDRGLRQRSIGGVGHTQEWERQVSFICMAFGQPELRAQLSADVLSYTTRSDTSQPYTSSQGQFSAVQSPSIRLTSQPATGSTRSAGMSIGFDERVPVYDARNTVVDLSDVSNIHQLPTFDGEVPPDSLAVVGYTTNAYFSNKDHTWHVSCNLQFVVLLGTPDEEEDVPEGDVQGDPAGNTA